MERVLLIGNSPLHTEIEESSIRAVSSQNSYWSSGDTLSLSLLQAIFFADPTIDGRKERLFTIKACLFPLSISTICVVMCRIHCMQRHGTVILISIWDRIDEKRTLSIRVSKSRNGCVDRWEMSCVGRAQIHQPDTLCPWIVETLPIFPLNVYLPFTRGSKRLLKWIFDVFGLPSMRQCLSLWL